MRGIPVPRGPGQGRERKGLKSWDLHALHQGMWRGLRWGLGYGGGGGGNLWGSEVRQMSAHLSGQVRGSEAEESDDTGRVGGVTVAFKSLGQTGTHGMQLWVIWKHLK